MLGPSLRMKKKWEYPPWGNDRVKFAANNMNADFIDCELSVKMVDTVS